MNVKMTRLSWIAVIVTVLLVSVLSIAGFSCGGKGPETTKHTITTGAKVDLTTQTIGTSGGVINISKTGDPLDGLQIEVPSGSYSDSRNFKVSYAPVESHTFGENFNPISPLITIDNGGGYSDELITVKIPIQLPDDQFAMAFYYDDSSGKLEGIPLVDEDNDSITIVTRHFSNLLISRIALNMLTGVFDSGFRPGVDDWQFDNNGSYISPGGHCWGQSLTAMWYYCEKYLNGAAHLYGLYDNNGGKKTPSFWEDDSLGYRLASTVQQDEQANNVLIRLGEYISQSDELAYKAFAYSILLTGEPQYVRISTTTGTWVHAMVVYKVANNTLFIADPNYQGDTDRKIELKGGNFTPYHSGANAAAIQQGQGKAYDKIDYLAKTAFIDWGQIATRWQELEDKTIGNDRFPGYTLKVLDEQRNEKELEDGFKKKSNILTLWSVEPGLGISVYRDGQVLQPTQPGGYEFTLQPGNNELGIYIVGQVNNDWEYVDFKYYNVIYEAPTPTPTHEAGITGDFSGTNNNISGVLESSGTWELEAGGARISSEDEATNYTSIVVAKNSPVHLEINAKASLQKPTIRYDRADGSYQIIKYLEPKLLPLDQFLQKNGNFQCTFESSADSLTIDFTLTAHGQSLAVGVVFQARYDMEEYTKEGVLKEATRDIFESDSYAASFYIQAE